MSSGKTAWTQSLGSNKALELLRSKSVDFGSTAGAAAFLGRANGNPIKSIYLKTIRSGRLWSHDLSPVSLDWKILKVSVLR